MSPAEPTEPLKEMISPPQVWETLTTSQHQIFRQAIVSLCEEILLIWQQEESDELRADG